MALVAYSDESDFSDTEETQDDLKDNLSTMDSKTLSENNKIVFSTINDIEDDDDAVIPYIEQKTKQSNNSIIKSLLSSVPSAKSAEKPLSTLDVSQENDTVDDVPTVKTWCITKEIKNSSHEDSAPVKISVKKDMKNKLKFILPSLSEFDDDSDEENVDKLPKKKIAPSSTGSGLFSILPKPKGITSSASLVPLHVSKRQKTQVVKKRLPSQKPSSKQKNEGSDDDDEVTVNKDFFSLSEDDPKIPSVFSTNISSMLPTLKASDDIINEIPTHTDVNKYDNSVKLESKESDNFIKPLPLDDSYAMDTQPISGSSSVGDFSSINNEALVKLTGKRNKDELINLIDVKADDALMSKHEWMTRSLTETKPTRSFSKKQDGNPTSQQKRKHQITYLAHQAQEREQDLKTTWSQNRYTKMQTQSKYGF